MRGPLRWGGQAQMDIVGVNKEIMHASNRNEHEKFNQFETRPPPRIYPGTASQTGITPQYF